MEGSKRILLSNFSKFLLSVGISYQKCSFENFRSPWETKQMQQKWTNPGRVFDGTSCYKQ